MDEIDACFAPVCLYPHTAYRTADGVRALFERYLSKAEKYLIVVADRLLALDRLVTGRFLSESGVFVTSRREAEQVARLIRRIQKQCGAQGSGSVVYWDEIADLKQYTEFTEKFLEAILGDSEMFSCIVNFVERRVERFGLGASSTKERAYEQEYLLSEICMSVFCTEVLGYAKEIWERPPPKDVPDPLKALYQNHRDLVTKVTGRPVKRALEFVFDGE